MAGGPVIANSNRVRIKGRKGSVTRFFIISVAYTVVWIALSSQLGHYRAEYGPQILLQMSISFYLPSIPVLLLSSHVEKVLEMLIGSCRSMQYRLLFGLGGCCVISALYPFMHHQLRLMLGAVMLLGACSAIAFSTSYQLVAWFRAADTIALGIGCVGSGPIVLILQVALGLKVEPLPWQWITMFQACAAITVLGMLCTMSLFWQYGDIISGKVPYVERPLLAEEGEEEEEEEDEFDEQDNRLAFMLSRMVSVADPFQGMPLHFAGHVDEDYARMLRAHGLVRRVASADSDLGFLRITAPTDGPDYSALSRLPMKGPVPPKDPGLSSSADNPIPEGVFSRFSGAASHTSLASLEDEASRAQVQVTIAPATGLPDAVHADVQCSASVVMPSAANSSAADMKQVSSSPAIPPPRPAPLRVTGLAATSAPPTFSLADTIGLSPPAALFSRSVAEEGTHQDQQQQTTTRTDTTWQEESGDDVQQLGAGGDVQQDDAAGESVSPFVNGTHEQVLSVAAHPDIVAAAEKLHLEALEAHDAEAAEDDPHESEHERQEKKEDGLRLTVEALSQLWMLIVWSLAASTIINLVFPFFTYAPSSGLLGDYLPQTLFYIRIMADIGGRFLPRLKGPFALKSISSIVALSGVMCCVSSLFFVLLHIGWSNDWVWLAIVIFLWFTGGFVNTNSFTLAPNMVDSRLTAQASALMALTYQVAHFLGLVLAAVLAAVMFGDITGGH